MVHTISKVWSDWTHPVTVITCFRIPRIQRLKFIPGRWQLMRVELVALAAWQVGIRVRTRSESEVYSPRDSRMRNTLKLDTYGGDDIKDL